MGRKKKEEEVANELTIFPAFEPLFNDNLDDPRYYQVYGGRGSGKSFTVACAMVDKTYSEYGHKILYLRQTMTTSEDSTIADVRAAINAMGVGHHFKESKGMIINITTGSTITFKGIRSAGSQSAKLKSLSGITTLVIEEAEETESFEEFSKIDESIRIVGKPLKVILVYNPTSSMSSWIHEEWFKSGMPKVERMEDTLYIHTTYKDNLKNLNAKLVERWERLAETNPIYYRNTILAEWTLEAQDRIYAGWGHYEILEEEGDTWYGLDFGYGGNDKTSCIKITFIDDVYYVQEMFSEAKMSMRMALSRMRRAGIPYNAPIYADSAMPLLIEEIRAGGYASIRKAKKGDVEAGIKKVQNKNIVIVGDLEKQNKNLYYSYMTFSWDDKGKRPHEPDELAALRYGINSKKPLSKPLKNVPVSITRRGGFR